MFGLQILAHVAFLYCSAAATASQQALSNHDDMAFGGSVVTPPPTIEQGVLQQARPLQPLEDMLYAIETMQDTYFSVYGGTWPEAIDWTRAVMGTHISATLSSLVMGLDKTGWKRSKTPSCVDRLHWENIINKYYMHTVLFYFGENAFALRNQAYDDMLWVVLGWLENAKFAKMYSIKHWEEEGTPWHGMQMTTSAAHRARVFYELASKGWNMELCNGGMIWNPDLEPYKNAITNELFAAASIAMYLYFPGDNNTSPYITDNVSDTGHGGQHDPMFLDNAVKSYRWLQKSGMRSLAGLYQDGFHVSGWTRFRNGTIDPGTGKCDALNTMVYTYNQGVILSASRGLWLATGAKSYLDDGHHLIQSVMNATGWRQSGKKWSGLGRNGVLEDFCDHGGYCSQDGQTFKGIFFHHLSEFCRPLWPQEEQYLVTSGASAQFDRFLYHSHLDRCASYEQWITHNAQAALKTRNDRGLFGMWWGISPDFSSSSEDQMEPQKLPPDADDHLNPHIRDESFPETRDLNRRGRGRTVETQSGGLAVLRSQWQWVTHF